VSVTEQSNLFYFITEFAYLHNDYLCQFSCTLHFCDFSKPTFTAANIISCDIQKNAIRADIYGLGFRKHKGYIFVS
jgi:hypothetical protein